MNHQWENTIATICLTLVALFFIHSCTGFITEKHINARLEEAAK